MLQCASCGLFWQREPSLSPEYYREARHFEIDNKEKLNAVYENAKNRIQVIKKYVSLDNLCDIGCGEGIFLKALADDGYKNEVGVEPSAMIREFAEKYNLHIKEGSIESVDRTFLEKNNLHTITMFHVIEHLDNPLDSLSTLFAVMKKNDVLVIETPDMNSYLLKKTKYENDIVYPEHLFYFNRSNLLQLLGNIGFNLIASGKRDFDPEHRSISDSLQKLGIMQPFKKELAAAAHLNTKNDDSTKASRDRGIIKGVARKLLTRAVSLLKRGNYVWVVVRK